ncbi:MAG: TIGR03032 family protein [Alphaproteobacteria bacterium]|nr:TIGR03032 family protein [Alphaproteobacteria bacterium]
MNDTTAQPKLELTVSRQFTSWMAEHGCSLLFTTYQTGKLFLLGLKPDGKLSVFERTFNRCMGLGVDATGFWMSSLYQLWRFENALEPGQRHNGYDRLYVPQVGYTTGDLDIHDIAVDRHRRPVFVNTLFGCLATTSVRTSFTPLWQPPFITKLAAEDRCHLNGLAMENGSPRYVTAVSRSDLADGWRDRRRDGGCIIDVPADKVIAEGLSMPHSPRIHDGRLWVLDSGNGFLCTVDPATGAAERVAFCPGYARGLAFLGPFAVIGLSRPRDNKTFQGLALDEELAKRGGESRCGLLIIDTRTGDAVHWLRAEGIVSELYEVAILPGVQRPMALGFKSEEIRRTITVGPSEPLH